METSDAGLWMKLDSSPSQLQAQPEDDVVPLGGSTEPNANNSSVTLSNKAADATEAEANPSSLDRQLMATQVDEGTVNTGHMESVDREGPSRDNNFNQAADQAAASAAGTVGRMETGQVEDPSTEENESHSECGLAVESRSQMGLSLTGDPAQDEPQPPDEELKSRAMITTGIQRGEQLLQRLQVVQQRQDGSTALEEKAATGTQDDEEPRARWQPEEAEEAVHRKPDLQRAGGLFNLADHPDVLEIPFQTSLSLEPGHGAWRFSEQTMQKEISVEVQRELVLVKEGKIPGGYSKGEVRQLKETRLLFEAPTPSVLERTRSLETVSLKSCAVTRAQSLRLHASPASEPETGPGPRDKTRSSPYPPKDKHLRRPGAAEAAGLLQQNPFFKLRPALALQPEVEKDIREARDREEELRRQRCSLYGDDGPESPEEQGSRSGEEPGVGRQTAGKLDRVWPPPSKQPQPEPRAHRAGGPRAALWQRWESGLIDGRRPQDHN